MRKVFFTLFCCLTLHNVNALDLKKYLKEKNSFSRSNLEYLEQGRVIVKSEVQTIKAEGEEQKKQKLTLYLAGLHSEKCETSIEKLKEYEKFSEYITFITKSTYDESNKHIAMNLNGSPFVPIDFTLEVTIDRLSTPKTYPYIMGAGLFQGLKGDLDIVQAPENRCLYYVTGDYLGQSTGMPDFVVETLANGIGKKGLERLFKISGHQEK